MEVVQGQHSVYRLSYHIVWMCKYRRRVLKPGVVDYIKKLLPKLLRSIPGCEIEKIGFDKDHVHFVMTNPPRYAIADVMAKLKSQSSSQIRAKFTWLNKVYFKENVFWCLGYDVDPTGWITENIWNQHKEDVAQSQLTMDFAPFTVSQVIISPLDRFMTLRCSSASLGRHP